MRNAHLMVADYNADVLALATLPNLLLSYASTSPNYLPWAEHGDLEISPEAISMFKDRLTNSNISISGISGAWGPVFTELVKHSYTANDTDQQSVNILLASETIYSPISIYSFTRTLLTLIADLRTVEPGCRTIALVAAKRVYFGVGGGINEFVAVVEEMGGYAREIWDSEEQGERGVGRCILEVGLR